MEGVQSSTPQHLHFEASVAHLCVSVDTSEGLQNYQKMTGWKVSIAAHRNIFISRHLMPTSVSLWTPLESSNYQEMTGWKVSREQNTATSSLRGV
jgi:hypothetical protein